MAFKRKNVCLDTGGSDVDAHLHRTGGAMQNIADGNSYSRWSTEEEITSFLYKIKLDDRKPHPGGIPLFADSDSVYIDTSDSHSLVIGSTGSKKTRLIGMPALQIYAEAGESFVVIDPKAELYERTLPLLKQQKYKTFVLNLRDPPQSDGWNPLIIPFRLYRGGQRDKATELIRDMANCIVKQGYYYREPYWINSAANLLTGLLLILFECAQEKEINLKSLRALKTEAFKIASDNSRSDNSAPYIREHFLQYVNSSSFVNSLLSGTVNVCDTTRGCIVSEFDQAMEPFFSQDNLVDLLSGNDLDMAKIGRKKTAVFLIIPDGNTVYNCLISVFVKQCYAQLIIEAQKRPYKALYRRVNFLLDEFASLPSIADFPSMITASRSRGIRFCLMVQSVKQLEAKYGIYTEAIKGNCENWVILHSRERELLAEIAEICGKNADDEPLVSMTLLQTLDKGKGEAFVLHKRERPFIARLPDINRYHVYSADKKTLRYPRNKHKADAVFDFKDFCHSKGELFMTKLFSGKTLDEIQKECDEDDGAYYMTNEDMIQEPIFTVQLPQEEEQPDSSYENMPIPQETKVKVSLLERIKEAARNVFKGKE